MNLVCTQLNESTKVGYSGKVERNSVPSIDVANTVVSFGKGAQYLPKDAAVRKFCSSASTSGDVVFISDKKLTI